MNFNYEEWLDHPWVQNGLTWIIVGLGVGVAAKLLLPGSEKMGWIRTILLGLGGCFLGNAIAPKLFDWPSYSTLSWPGLAMGVAGALVLVITNRLVTKS